MSLSTPHQSISLHPSLLFSRQANDAGMIYCTYKEESPKTKWHSSAGCPKAYDEIIKCNEEQSRENCEKACKMIGDGSVMKEYMKCAKDRCSNYDEIKEKEEDLEKMWETEVFVKHRGYCELQEFIKPKGSSAGFVKGWKGASAVAMLAFGSMFLF
ncbi:hypothetical protein BJ508DRAFT_420013 [Ascobolus immersus RN42]|uniref:Uncharacterized protein n=1 Tax=Ascobolus immersus RN42 TaxID=1160509 RepID=A0A3N4HDR0_ASCIM|nr:hypothetical protein BJ508DRAFT_420013 [Ascobolus immersus RN42]